MRGIINGSGDSNRRYNGLEGIIARGSGTGGIGGCLGKLIYSADNNLIRGEVAKVIAGRY